MISEFPRWRTELIRRIAEYKERRESAGGESVVAHKHGMWKTSEFKTWQRIIRRCGDRTYHSYSYYGGRGIKVADEWKTSFLSFYNEVGPKPTPKHEIDRIDNNGNYEPGNVRWATHAEQSRNRRTTRIYEFKGVRHCIKEWAKIIGLKTGTLQWRFNHGWTIEEAFDTRLKVNGSKELFR